MILLLRVPYYTRSIIYPSGFKASIEGRGIQGLFGGFRVTRLTLTPRILEQTGASRKPWFRLTTKTQSLPKHGDGAADPSPSAYIVVSVEPEANT